jgi:hypothetical protein
MSSKHWPVMQAIEDLRHRAELLEQKALQFPGARGAVLRRIAARMRELAEEEAALVLESEPATARRAV